MLIYPIDTNDFSRKYVLTKDASLQKKYIIDEFLVKSKVDSQKYAGRMLKSIISNFFDRIEDMEYVYNRFYSLEYDTFKNYLYKKMLLDKVQIDFLFSNLKDAEKLYYVDIGKASMNIDENLFRYDEEDFLKKINMILEEIT